MKNPQLLKQSLRKQIVTRIARISESQLLRQGLALQNKLLSSDIYKNAKRIGIYVSLPYEVPTDLVISDMLRTDPQKHCFVPVIQPDRTLKMVRVYSVEDLQSFPVNKYNIPEPSPFYLMGADEVKREDALEQGGLDVIIVPGVAFDKQGGRLGRGKGYYDNFLAQCHKLAMSSGCKMPTTVGLAFREQVVECVPREDHDRKVDFVLDPESPTDLCKNENPKELLD